MKGWSRHPRFNAILNESWNEEIRGNPLESFSKKLKRLKDPLKSLNEEKIYNIFARVENDRIILEEA